MITCSVTNHSKYAWYAQFAHELFTGKTYLSSCPFSCSTRPLMLAWSGLVWFSWPCTWRSSSRLPTGLLWLWSPPRQPSLSWPTSTSGPHSKKSSLGLMSKPSSSYLEWWSLCQLCQKQVRTYTHSKANSFQVSGSVFYLNRQLRNVNSPKKHAWRASTLRADKGWGISGLLVTYP